MPPRKEARPHPRNTVQHERMIEQSQSPADIRPVHTCITIDDMQPLGECDFLDDPHAAEPAVPDELTECGPSCFLRVGFVPVVGF